MFQEENSLWLKFICHAMSECSYSFSPNFFLLCILLETNMFNSSALCRRKERQELRERKESQCSQDSGYSVISHELRILRKEFLWSAASSPARMERSPCDKVTCQRQLIRLGMTPVRLPEKVSEPVEIKGERLRSRTICSTNTPSQSLQSGSSGQLFTSGSSPHIRLWKQAYAFGCR